MSNCRTSWPSRADYFVVIPRCRVLSIPTDNMRRLVETASVTEPARLKACDSITRITLIQSGVADVCRESHMRAPSWHIACILLRRARREFAQGEGK